MVDRLCTLLGIKRGQSSAEDTTLHYAAHLCNSGDPFSAVEGDYVLVVQPYWIEEMFAAEQECNLNVLQLAQCAADYLEELNTRKATETFLRYCLIIPTFRAWRCFQAAVHLSEDRKEMLTPHVTNEESTSAPSRKPFADYVFDVKRIISRLQLLYPEMFLVLNEIQQQHMQLPLPPSASGLTQLLLGLQHFGTEKHSSMKLFVFKQLLNVIFNVLFFTAQPLCDDPRMFNHIVFLFVLSGLSIYNELLCKACVELNRLKEAKFFFDRLFVQVKSSFLKNTGTLPPLLPTSLLPAYVVLYSTMRFASSSSVACDGYESQTVFSYRLEQVIKSYLHSWVVRGKVLRHPWGALACIALLHQAELWVALTLSKKNEIVLQFRSDHNKTKRDRRTENELASKCTISKPTVHKFRTQTAPVLLHNLITTLNPLRLFSHSIELAEKQRRTDLILMLSSFFFHDKQPHVAEPSKDMVPTSLNMRRNGISRVRQALKFGTESGTLPRYLSSLGVLCFWELDTIIKNASAATVSVSGIVAQIKGNSTEAIDLLTRSAMSGQQNSYALTLLALVTLSTASFVENKIPREVQQGVQILACDYVNRAYQISQSLSVGFILAFLYFYLGRFALCLGLTRRLLYSLPNDVELRYIKALSHLKLGLTDVGKRKGHTHWFAATYDLRLCSVLLYNILRRILHYDVSNVETKCNDFDFSTESQALKKASSLTFDGNGQRKQTTEARLVIRRLRHIQQSLKHLERLKRCVDVSYKLMTFPPRPHLGTLNHVPTVAQCLDSTSNVFKAPLLMPSVPLLFEGSNLWTLFLFGNSLSCKTSRCTTTEPVLSPEYDKLLLAHFDQQQQRRTALVPPPPPPNSFPTALEHQVEISPTSDPSNAFYSRQAGIYFTEDE